MARPGTGSGSSGGGFSGSRSSGGSSSGGRSSGSSRPSGGGSSSGSRSSGGGSSSGGRSSSGRSSSSGGSFSSRTSSTTSSTTFFGRSDSSPKKYTTSSSSSSQTQQSRSSGSRPMGGPSPSNQNQNNHSSYGQGGGYHGGPGYSGGYGHHHGHPYRRPGLFRRMFYRRGYSDNPYQTVSYVKSGLGCGCLLFFILPFLAALVLVTIPALIGYNTGGSGESGTVQTTEYNNNTAKEQPQPIRTRLSPDKVTETDYYADDLGWIEEPEQLLSGLTDFYQKTGVQPYLKLVPPVSDTNTVLECEAFANRLYDELFSDEGHFLLVYIEDLNPDKRGTLSYVCGSDATSVMDDPAVDILYQYVDLYWPNEDYTTEEVFSNAFRDTASDIMHQSLMSGSWLNTENGWEYREESGEPLFDTWAEIDGIKYYFTPDGYLATGWFEHSGNQYYADENGTLITGWFQYDNQWYYFTEDGICLKNTTTPDGYYVDENGIWTP